LNLGRLYKRYSDPATKALPSEIASLSWIPERFDYTFQMHIMVSFRILHSFHQPCAEDKLLCEKLLTTCVAPYDLDVEPRMRALHLAYMRADENSIKFVSALFHY
jgi:hypothetical protein